MSVSCQFQYPPRTPPLLDYGALLNDNGEIARPSAQSAEDELLAPEISGGGLDEEDRLGGERTSARIARGRARESKEKREGKVAMKGSEGDNAFSQQDFLILGKVKSSPRFSLDDRKKQNCLLHPIFCTSRRGRLFAIFLSDKRDLFSFSYRSKTAKTRDRNDAVREHSPPS